MLLVLGSINIDLTTYTGEIPKVGETVTGKAFQQFPGGKGANQAVCAAKLGTKVCFLGKVGNDSYGEYLLKGMAESGIDISHIEKSDISTGLAAINVDSSGRNSIIVVPGANALIDKNYIDRHIDVIKKCDIILAQHETPLEATEYAFKIAKSQNKITVLNPAPAASLSEDIISCTDILVPNEHELSRITGQSCSSVEEISGAAKVLAGQGIKCIIVTMGHEGVLLHHNGRKCIIPAYSVSAVDTTAAGDSFLGGFIDSYMKYGDIKEAIIQGQMVASYSVQFKGAQSSMPSYEQFMEHKNKLLSSKII